MTSCATIERAGDAANVQAIHIDCGKAERDLQEAVRLLVDQGYSVTKYHHPAKDEATLKTRIAVTMHRVGAS